MEPVWIIGKDGKRYSPTHYKTREKPKRAIWENQTESGQNNLPPSDERWKIRSKTYLGIAKAMANQWG